MAEGSLIQRLSDRWYPTRNTREPFTLFLEELLQHLDSSSNVIDLGAGAGSFYKYKLKGCVSRIVGVDAGPRVLSNPLLDEGRVGDLCALPFPEASFDVAFSIYVLEHIADPNRFCREVARVLKPGGWFLALTPNRYHYVSLAAAATPLRFHRFFNRLRGVGDEDSFRTEYRLNTRRSLTRHFTAAGFQVQLMRFVEVRPNYLTFSLPLFLLGAAYERLLNAVPALAGLRANIICGFSKPREARSDHNGSARKGLRNSAVGSPMIFTTGTKA